MLRLPLLRVTVPAVAAIAALSVPVPFALAQEAAVKPMAVQAPETRADGARLAGQDVPVPKRTKYVAPEYPAEAASQGIRGIVILEVVIGEDGKVQNARVTRSIPGLDEAALAAVRLWEYEPSKLSGKAVAVRLSQSITFALKLPDLQRAPGVPELKSGGAPPPPPPLAAPETASVVVALGAQGEVKEAAILDGHPVVSEALLRAVKAWRFQISEGSTPPSFTVRAEWTAGPTPSLTLKALDLKNGTSAASAAPPPAGSPAPGAPPNPAAAEAADAAATTTAAAVDTVDTEVIPARQEPAAKEQGASAVADVILGDHIPDLVKGRRPIWPPMARLGNVMGEVVVRFSVDLAGKVTVHSAEGPDLLKASGEQAVATWLFRRTAIDRLHLIATFKFSSDRSVARVERASSDPS
jgi:protein TonB